MIRRTGKMRNRTGFRRLLSGTTIIGYGLSLILNSAAYALPQNGHVSSGVVDIRLPSAKILELDQSSRGAVIDWDSFNVEADETVRVFQPGADSWLLNRVNGSEASRILGNLQANGGLTLVNPSGITVGNNAKIDVGSLILSTQDIANEDFMNGVDSGSFSFGGDGLWGLLTSEIVNNGEISVSDGGLAALVAPSVTNNGLITANLGKVALAGGNQVTVDLYGDDLIHFGAGAQVTNANGPDLISNHGTIEAAGGTVVMSASVAKGIVDNAINMSGTIVADSVAEENGEVILFGGAEGRAIVSGNISAKGDDAGETGGTIDIRAKETGLFAGGVLDASGQAGGGLVKLGGDFQGGIHEDEAGLQATVTFVGEDTLIDVSSALDAGEAIVWADDTTRFFGEIDASAIAGDGGDVEVSGKRFLTFEGFTDLTSVYGDFGHLLLDPDDITISTGADSNTTGNPTFSSAGGTANIQVSTLVTALSGANVTVTTADSITIANDITSAAANSLTLTAGTNIDLSSAVAVSLGGDFVANAPSGTFTTGGSSSINVTTGNVSLTANDFVINGTVSAGNEVVVVGPSAFTVGSAGELDITELQNLSGMSLKVEPASGGALTVVGLAGADTGGFGSEVEFFADTDVTFSGAASVFNNDLLVQANDDIFVNQNLTTTSGNMTLTADFNNSPDATDQLFIGANLTSGNQLSLGSTTGGLTLTGNSNWNVNGDVTVNDPLNGGFDLSIVSAPAVNVMFPAAIGGGTALNSLNINIGGTTPNRQIFLGDVTTTGAQNYTGDLRFSGTYTTTGGSAPIDVAATSTILLTADATFNTTGAASNIQFNAPIEPQTPNMFHLSATTGSAGDIFIQNVGAGAPLGQITLNGDDVTLSGLNYRTNSAGGHIAITSALGTILGADVTLDALGTGSNVTLAGPVNATAPGAEYLVVTANGNVALPVIGNTTRLEYVDVMANDITLNGNIATSMNNGTYGIIMGATDVTLGSSLTLDSNAGAIQLPTILGSGSEALTLIAPMSTIDILAAGTAANRLGGLTVFDGATDATNVTFGSIYSTGGVSVTNTGSTFNSGVTDVNAGAFSINSGITGVNLIGPFSVNGTASITSAGGIDLAAGGSALQVLLTANDGVNVGSNLTATTSDISIDADANSTAEAIDNIAIGGDLSAATTITLDALNGFVAVQANSSWTSGGTITVNPPMDALTSTISLEIDANSGSNDVFLFGVGNGNPFKRVSVTGNEINLFDGIHVTGGDPSFGGIQLIPTSAVITHAALQLRSISIGLDGHIDILGSGLIRPASDGLHSIVIDASETNDITATDIGISGFEYINVDVPLVHDMIVSNIRANTAINVTQADTASSPLNPVSPPAGWMSPSINISTFSTSAPPPPPPGGSFCDNNPGDPSCQSGGVSFCAENPGDPSCSVAGSPGFCVENPTDPSCVPGDAAFCAENPTNQFCLSGTPEFCSANPADPSCSGVSALPPECATSPGLPQCVIGSDEFCQTVSNDPACPGFDPTLDPNFCLDNPADPICLAVNDPQFCIDNPADPFCSGVVDPNLPPECLADPSLPQCLPDTGDPSLPPECLADPGLPQCGPGTGGPDDPTTGDPSLPPECAFDPGLPQCQPATGGPDDPFDPTLPPECAIDPTLAQCQPTTGGPDDPFDPSLPPECAINPSLPQCGPGQGDFVEADPEAFRDACIANPDDPLCMNNDAPELPEVPTEGGILPDFGDLPPPPPPGGDFVDAPLPNDDGAQPPAGGNDGPPPPGEGGGQSVDQELILTEAARPGDVGVMDFVGAGQSGGFQDADDDEEEGTSACQCN